MNRLLIPVVSSILVFSAGCASKTFFNQSFLTSEELKLSANSGYVSLKSTGETMDLSGIRTAEPGAKNIVIIKVHGTFIVTGDGFRKVWKLWPACGKDAARYSAIKVEPAPVEIKKPVMEKSGECALVKWDEDAGPRQVYINSKGTVSPEKCVE
jgi:hypothetical protein